MKRSLLLLCLLLCLAALTGCYSETDPWPAITPVPQDVIIHDPPIPEQPTAHPALTELPGQPQQPTAEPVPSAEPEPGLNG